MSEPGAAELRRVCAWCEQVLADGEPGAPTTHGICATCRDRLLREFPWRRRSAA